VTTLQQSGNVGSTELCQATLENIQEYVETHLITFNSVAVLVKLSKAGIPKTQI
jgi:hypothetical protein